ncbi:alpha/beta hydrolase [Spirosoma endbachense]|uniref:Prolyl oligopeptidase family serine peptidase n=1 Tax=Spirosoma endbachense TaxID=2666025 RepID=A0A6P1VMW5_9BACT|nr:alpha/beta hydrolase [Spirosoma endbachense]QHV94631.1 prolyl oligopeptidase family serine peptidase [Spirosoma endbachense]
MKKYVWCCLFALIGLIKPIGSLGQSGQLNAKEPARIQDVIYDHKFGTALTMDILKPAKPNGIGVIFVLSGGWHSDISMIEKRRKHFHYFTDRGQTVFLVIHGSAPKFQVSEVIQDAHRAVRFIRFHAAEYGVNPNRLGMSGMSSGGHISLSIGTGVGLPSQPDSIQKDASATIDPVDGVSSRVQAVACFFPPADLVNFGNPGRLFVECDTVRRYWPQFGVEGKSRDEKLAIMQKLSPYHQISTDDPPTLILHGTVDPIIPLEQSERFIAQLKKTGVPAQLIIHQGGAHGWDETWESDLGVLADWFEKYLLTERK